MRAIGERIAVAALERIGDLCGAGRADRRIRRDLRCARRHRALSAIRNSAAARRRRRRSRCGRCAPAAAVRVRARGDEALDRREAAADPDQHAVGVVEHLADEAKLAREAPDGGAEADALHAAAHANFDRHEQLIAGELGNARSCRELPQQHAVVAGIGDRQRRTARADAVGPAQAVARGGSSSGCRPCQKTRAGRRGSMRARPLSRPARSKPSKSRIRGVGDDQALGRDA